MKFSKVILVFLVFLGFTFMGYQCGSTELTSAKLYISQKNYDKALPLLEQEVQKNPKSDEGFYLLGIIYGETEQFDKMSDAYSKSLAISKNYEEDIKNNKQYYWVNLFNKGVKSYQEGVNTQGTDSSKIHFSKAANYFEQAALVEPDSADTYQNLAFVYMNMGEFDKAVEPLKIMIDKDTSVEGYRYLGEILYEQGVKQKETDSVSAMQVFDEAIKVLEAGRKIYPNDPDILLSLSNSYIAANKLDIARDVFKTGVATEPTNQYYRYNYGVLLLGANEFEEAEQQFLKAIEIDPKYQNALYNLGVTYVRWGTHLSEVADQKGETTSQHKEKYQMAIPHLEKLVELEPDNITAWDLLGKVYSVLNMQKEAEAAYNKVDQLRQK